MEQYVVCRWNKFPDGHWQFYAVNQVQERTGLLWCDHVEDALRFAKETDTDSLCHWFAGDDPWVLAYNFALTMNHYHRNKANSVAFYVST